MSIKDFGIVSGCICKCIADNKNDRQNPTIFHGKFFWVYPRLFNSRADCLKNLIIEYKKYSDYKINKEVCIEFLKWVLETDFDKSET